MVQEIIVGILFLIAILYIVNVFRKQAKAKGSCGEANCKCDSTTATQRKES